MELKSLRLLHGWAAGTAERERSVCSVQTTPSYVSDRHKEGVRSFYRTLRHSVYTDSALALDCSRKEHTSDEQRSGWAVLIFSIGQSHHADWHKAMHTSGANR